MPITPTPKIWMNGDLVDWDNATHPRGNPHAALRHRCVRGHPCLRDVAGAGRVPADRPHRAPPQLGQDPRHVDPVHGRGAGRGHQGDGRLDRAAGLLRAPDRLLRIRRDGSQHDAVLGRRGDHVLAVGCLSRRRRARRRACVSRPRRGRVTTTTSCRRRRRPPATTSTRRSPRSRRSRPATTRRSCSPATVSSPSAPARTCSCRGNDTLITPPLSAGALEGITQNTVMTLARDLGYDCRVRQPRPQRSLHRRRDVPGRHRRRGELGQLGRRPFDPVPGPEDAGDRRALRPSRPRPGRPVQGLVRARRLDVASTVIR